MVHPGRRLQPLVRDQGQDVAEEVRVTSRVSAASVPARSPATSRSTWSRRRTPARRTSPGSMPERGQECWKYSAAPWSIAQVRPCQTSRLGLLQVRSTLAVKASSHRIARGLLRRRRPGAVVAEGAGQEVDAEVEADARGEQVLHLLVRLVAGDPGVQVDARRSGTRTEGAGDLADDDLGDQHLGALSGAAELQHVGAVVVGLDDAGQRPALTQWRDVAIARTVGSTTEA